MKSSVIGLGLESSCDETAVAVVEDGRLIRSNIISSQIDLHREYYGVVPEIASRAHLEAINPLIDRALDAAGVGFGDLDYVAATNRPGLVGSLLIALQSAKVISYAMDIPLMAVNHLEAHLYTPFLEGNELAYPFIGLLVSGGNTALYHVRGTGDMELIGRTADDAAGEAFDKIAKYMDLGYPGGPVIERLARSAARGGVLFPKILPDPGDFRFSYSGIKTAVINHLKKHPDAVRAEVAYGFQERVLEIMVRRIFAAAREREVRRMVVAGGVAANGRLRELLAEEKRPDETVIMPSPALCTDNAAMVAGIGYHYFLTGRSDDRSVDVHARV
ncbi:MAG: tRNA (adenosine(37)-N6)-threonylcarbamoyltransferase complex transferase subunit TsaD [Spirochaetes bacterium RBG_16_49_21]|nr:MAG: tRNA (adenosine(37)-N6)-threonylcarbamoyltransferase complex transferase subunit TsaD [Spirochaetes bacterium RBG_16_49_21]